MARTDYPETNVTTFSAQADTLENDIFIDKIGLDGGTAGQTVVLLDKNDNLVFRWTIRSGNESELIDFNRRSRGIKFSALSGTAILYGKVTGTPTDITP